MHLRALVGVLTVALAVGASAQPGGGPGPHGPGGPGRHGGGARGPGDPEHAADRALFHQLLDHRAEITRHVTEVPGGVETVTESVRAEVAAKIREHVRRMKARIEEGRPIRMRDPLFAEIFRHAKKITMRVEDTERGVRVVETSDDPWVTGLIREHARVVSAFLEHGYDEARRNHPLPPRP